MSRDDSPSELPVLSPDDFLRRRKQQMRRRLRLAVYAIAPAFLRRGVTIELPAAMLLFGRYHNAAALRQTHPEAVRAKLNGNIRIEQLPYGIYAGADEIRLKTPFDRLAFCAWEADPEAFDRAAAAIEQGGARRLAGAELSIEFANSYLIELIGIKPTAKEQARIMDAARKDRN